MNTFMTAYYDLIYNINMTRSHITQTNLVLFSTANLTPVDPGLLRSTKPGAKSKEAFLLYKHAQVHVMENIPIRLRYHSAPK